MLCGWNLKVMSKVGAAQEHVRKALDVKSSIESTLSRIHKLNIVNTVGSQQAASCGKQSYLCQCWDQL